MKKSLKLTGAVLALAYAGQVGAVESFVKKTLDGACLAMEHPEFYDTKIYIRKNTMEECIASGGKEEREPPLDEDAEELQQVAER